MPKLHLGWIANAQNRRLRCFFVLKGTDKSYSLPLPEGLDWLDVVKTSGSEGSLKSYCAPAAKLEGVAPGEHNPIATHGNGGVLYPFKHKLIVQ